METTVTPTPTAIDWAKIAAELAAPFAPEDVEWRAQGKAGADGKTQVLPYIDARAVQDRLDAVVGIAGWSFTLEPLVMDKGELMVARGRLAIWGISKDDIGTASNFEASKGTASDALKRAAVQWGVGRYLYALPVIRMALEKGFISDAQRKQLAEGLRRRMPKAA